LIPVGDDPDDPRVIQLILFKVLIVSFGGYIVFLCFPLFRVERHLAVVNSHRDVALRTFQTFAEAARTDPIRDAVLIETTRAIFSAGATGLIDGREPVSQHPAALMEVFRGASAPTGTPE
jgi:hypothetical protein